MNGEKEFDLKIIYLILGIFLIICYVVLGLSFNSFVSMDYNYLAIGLFHKADIMAMLAKIVFILPATILIALYLKKSSINIKFELFTQNANYFIVIFLIFTLILLIISVQFVLQKTPVTDDEATYVFQAKILQSGRIFAQPPPVNESFKNLILINDNNKWTGHYPLGHPLVLMLGITLGSPYVFTVLFSVLIILLVYFIGLELFHDRKTAFLASLFLGVSPLFIFTSSTLLSHTTSSFFIGLFLLFFFKTTTVDSERIKAFIYPLICGIAIGVVFNVRPLTAIGVGLPLAIAQLFKLFIKRAAVLKKTIFMILGFSLILTFTFWYNFQLNGDWFKFPVEYYDAFVNKGHDHSLINGILNLSGDLIKLNAFLFGLPISFIFIILLFVKSKLENGDKFCLAIIVSFIGCYLGWYFYGVSDTGPVYYYDILIPLVLLSSRGVITFYAKLSRWFPGYKNLLPYFILTSLCFSFFTFFPERSVYLKKLTDKIAQPYRIIKKADIKNALVFVYKYPRIGNIEGYPMNSPNLSDNIIFCHLLIGEINAQVINYFPNRNYFLLKFDKDKKAELTEVSAAYLTTLK